MVKLDNMSNLKDKNILVGVTGSISIYKSCDLIRTLVKEGVNVTVVMTSNAEKFISPMTFQSISGRKVFTNMYDTDESSLAHINLADNSDLIIVCPATANFISKYANGIADNLLLNILLATKSSIVVCPAMNVNMFENPLVQENVTKLSKLGISFVEPDSGDLLCGWEGKGRLADLNKISMAIKKKVSNKDLKEEKVLITCVSSRSPGKGKWQRIPCTTGSELRFCTNVSNSSWVVVSGKLCPMDLMQISSQVRFLLRTYTSEAGSSPTRTTARQGSIPLVFN